MTAVVTGPELVGAWISIFLTLCIFSFLYGDNPIYKLAEHLFLGVSIGITITELYWGSFKPNLIDRLADGRVLSLVPLVLMVMLFFKLNRRMAYVARLPIAFVVAAYAGVKLTGEANSQLMTQVAQSMPNLAEVYQTHGLWSWEADGAGLISSILVAVGLMACLLHFYFSAPQNAALRYISRFGILLLMLSFGASFGYTVMGRISLAIGRAQEMLGLDKPAAEVAVIQPRLATVICAILIIGGLIAWRRMQTEGDEEPG